MKPCLVIGSGFHSWVLGKPSTPLSSWDALIEEVSTVMKVSLPSVALSPVLRWERLLELAASDGYQHPADGTHWVAAGTHAVSVIELHAKLALKHVIEQHARKYPHQSVKARFPMSETFATVISLNFDNCWSGPTGYAFSPSSDAFRKGSLNKNEAGRLKNYMFEMKKPEKIFWFPNGSIQNASTIRMGLYDYGSQAHALKVAFNGIKAHEKEVEERLGTDDWIKVGPAIEAELAKIPAEQDPRIANWVAHFLYRPIYMAGVGLSQAETGMWWLLAQRARNLARVPLQNRPATVILADSNTTLRPLWANRPCGVEALYCENWDHGWELLHDKAKGPTVDGGNF
jgi:hypothetical protein